MSWWDEVYAAPHEGIPGGLIGAAALLFFAIVGFAVWRAQRPRTAFIPFEDFKTRTLAFDEWTIRLHQSGQGPHILLLHGIGANLFCWRELTPILNLDFTVTAIDLPGFGRSSKPPGASYGLDEQAERIERLLNELGIAQTYIVGNSMGGNIALWFAARFPERCLGLCLIAPATSARLIPIPLDKFAWASGPASYFLNRYAMRFAHGRTVSKRDLVGNDRIEETFSTYGRQPGAVRSFLLATRAIRDPRLKSVFEKLKARTLILWGSNDRLVNRAVINDLETALPKAESHVHVGGGHHLQQDEPAWVAKKLTEFFRS